MSEHPDAERPSLEAPDPEPATAADAPVAEGIDPETAGQPLKKSDAGPDSLAHDDWRDEARRLLHDAVSGVEETITAAKARLRRRLGTDDVRTVVTYRTFGTPARLHVAGRILANEIPGGPKDDDDWWRNLLATYKRWRSRQLMDVPVEIAVDGRRLEQRSDSQGYYDFEVDVEPPLDTDDGWALVPVCAPADAEHPTVETVARVLVPPPSARFGVISDMDDTVVHSDVSNLLAQAKLTFLQNAKGRKPLAGVGGLYRAFVFGKGGDGNPIFYVSSSAWNLYDLFEDFLDLNEIPLGPIHLQDVGLANNKLISPGHGHKLDHARDILDTYPDLGFVLVGDSGQRDAELYLQLAQERTDQVRAIYIRDVSPGQRTENTERVEALRPEAEKLGVPLLLVEDSVDIARHAADLGLIPEVAVDGVSESRDRDLGRT